MSLIPAAGLGGGVATFSGTSMAAPYVAAAAALAQQLALEELGRPLTRDEFRALLVASSAPIHDGDDERDNVTNTGLDFGRLHLLALAQNLVAWGKGGNSAANTPLRSQTPLSAWLRGAPVAGSCTVQIAGSEPVTGVDFGNFQNEPRLRETGAGG